MISPFHLFRQPGIFSGANFFLTTILALFTFLGFQSFAQTGAYTLNGGSATKLAQSYSATSQDQSAVLVENSGQLTLTGCTMSKTGDASSTSNSSQYGTNAGVLATSAGKVTIVAGSVTTNASGANGLFATGTGSTISMAGGTINASGDGAHGIDATYGGTIVLANVDVTSTGASSSALATDFGGGYVSVNGGTIKAAATAAGSHSAGIYSTGVIGVSNASVTSSGDCGGVIDGANSITLINTTLTGAVHGFKTWKTAPANGSASIAISGGSVTANGGDGFYVTGETGNGASATLAMASGATISTSTGNIVNVIKSSTASFAAAEENLTGNFIADATSTLIVTLTDTTMLTGKITNATVVLDSTSSWTLTDNSVLTSFLDPFGISGTTIKNVVGNGHSIHYDATLASNLYLGGKIYSLKNGGYLTPASVSGIKVDKSNTPLSWALNQNYPNPFNPTTNIVFSLPVQSHVSLKVYNQIGQLVSTLADNVYSQGQHQISFNGENLPSGVYYYRLEANGIELTKKMILQK